MFCTTESASKRTKSVGLETREGRMGGGVWGRTRRNARKV